jgi:hypothetical protein
MVAIVSMLDDAHTWLQLRDGWRVSEEQAAWAARWGTEALLARLSNEQAAEQKKPLSVSRRRRKS